MSEYGFIGNIPLANKLKKILFSEYTQSFYTITITNITLVFSIYILLNLKVFIKNYFLISLIFISIFILVISCGDEFIITKQIIAFLRIFPFMDKFKHYGYIIHFLIPLSLLITSISINYFLETKDKKNFFQSCLLAFLLKLICILMFFNFFNDYYDDINKTKILSNLIISYLTISLGLYFVLLHKNFKGKYSVIIILMIFSMLPTYIIAFEKYKNSNDFENVKTFYFQNNFSNKKKCIAFHKAVDDIPYFKNILSFAGNKYNIINFNLEKEICNPFAKIPVDGSKKNFSKYLSSGQSIELRNTNINNSLYLIDLFRNLKVNNDISLDGIINNEDKYLMISQKTKISLWTVVFRIQFAHTYLNDGTKNNRYPGISFHKNENNEWITKVDEEFKNEPLFEIVDNMKISNGFLKNTEIRFIDQINKKNNLYNFKTSNEGKYNLKFSFNKNWKLKDVNKNKLKKISNKHGYLSFNSDTKSDYILYYHNKIEFLIIFFQLILICYLILTCLLNLNRFYK